MKNNKLIKQFRIVAILEGFSWIALIITMILKYKFEIIYPNKIVGLIHENPSKIATIRNCLISLLFFISLLVFQGQISDHAI